MPFRALYVLIRLKVETAQALNSDAECLPCKGWDVFQVDPLGTLELQRCDLCCYFHSDPSLMVFDDEVELLPEAIEELKEARKKWKYT